MALTAPDWALLPQHMRGPMQRYLDYGIPPGGFLEAVLANDLSGAVARADAVNRRYLPEIVSFVQWYCPVACWGSPDAVSDWIADKQSSHRA